MPGPANDLNIHDAGFVVFDGVSVFSAGTAISSITGDTGSTVSGAIKLLGNTGSANAGSSVSFNGSSATELDLVTTDANSNTLIGLLAGNNAIANNFGACCAFGQGALHALTTGQFNNGFGYSALNSLIDGSNNTAEGHGALGQSFHDTDNTAVGYSCYANMYGGSFNTAVGSSAGSNIGRSGGSNNLLLGYLSGSGYTGGESSNICIANTGTVSESHVVRLGTQGSSAGQQNTCYIAGIVGNAVSNQELVTVNSSTGQMGVTAGTSGNLVLIQSQSPVAQTSITFTTGITTTYDDYFLTYKGVTCNGDNLNMQFSIDGGSTWKTDAGYSRYGFFINSGTQAGFSSTGQTSILFAQSLTNTTGDQAAGIVRLFDITSGSFCPNVQFTYNSVGSAFTALSAFGEYSTAAIAVNGIKIFSGTAFTGTFQLFGVVK